MKFVFKKCLKNEVSLNDEFYDNVSMFLNVEERKYLSPLMSRKAKT